MGLKDKIENNAVFLIAGAFAAGVAMGWVVIEKARINPIEQEKKNLVARLDRLEKYDIPSLVKGNILLLEPRQQCEIVRLYERLSIAIEKADSKEIATFYAKDYTSSLADKNAVFRAYKNLLGKKVLFYVQLIRHSDDGTVSVNVKAFYQSGNYMDSRDTLVFRNNDWKFVH